MVTSFPSPVLSVAVDVVRDLDGKEALSGLWNLFTKCKGSLQDGYRLENISWRLWHRELAAAAALAEPSRQLRRPSTPDDCFPSINTAPLSPVSEFGNQRDSQVVKVGQDLERPLRTPSPVPSTHSGISSGASSTRPPSVRSRSATSVGQIIVDMIPNNSIDASMQNCPVSEPVKHEPELELAASSLPSPVAEPVIAPFPTVILPAPSSQSSLGTLAVFPRVVIVNPTPHPTPPATPVPSQPPHTGGSHSSASVHLLPPPRASVALVNGHAKRAHATAPAPRLTVSNLASEATAGPSKSDNVPHSRQRRSRPTSPVPEHDRDACQISERDLSVEERSAILDRDSPSSESHTERRPPARSPSTSSNRSPSVSGANASSLASNQSTQTHASSVRRRQYAAHHPHRARFGQRAHPLVQRKAAGSEAQHKAGHAAFDVGSVTSDGSKATSGSQRRPSTGSTDTRISPVPHPAPMLTESPRPLQPIASPSRNAKTTSGPPLPGPAKPRANSDGPVVEKRPGLDPRSDLRAAQLREQPPRPQPPPPQPPKQAVNERRNVVLAPSDDEYETTESDISAGESSEWEDDEDEEEEDAVATEKQNRLREAALEAQRQRELFDKLPKRSYSNVPRTQSGLLSQLMNPDPNLFPPGHPVRTASSADVGRMPMPMPPRPLVPQRAPPMPALATSQSTTALPQLSAVTAQTQAQPPSNHYRPRGRPEGEELEDESSDEEGGDGDTSGGISRSLAQQRLAALADPNRRRSSQPSAVPQLQHSLQPAPDRPSLASVATAPIPLNHPWNLPPPAPPMTPRATRRQMLSTELSESLRRNLLWERQVSKTNLLRGGLRPLTQTRSEQPAPREEPREETEEQRRERERAERRRAALARNRSWADDYHYAGW